MGPLSDFRGQVYRHRLGQGAVVTQTLILLVDIRMERVILVEQGSLDLLVFRLLNLVSFVESFDCVHRVNTEIASRG